MKECVCVNVDNWSFHHNRADSKSLGIDEMKSKLKLETKFNHDALPIPQRAQMWAQVESSGKGRVGARSLAHNPLRGRGAGWSSGMGLGRVDKL